MSQEFNVGDVVVCVSPAPLLKRGAMYRINETLVINGHYGVNVDGVDVRKRGYPGIRAERFKKLPPASDEFTRQILACRPNKSRQPA